MKWRWDQGRLLYFQFDVLRNIAVTLVDFDGANMRTSEPMFRQMLSANTGMPFSPQNYTVIRNYKRVFECAFLATIVDDRLVVSDFARELAKEDGCLTNVDDYLLNYISRFRFPFPSFEGYDSNQPRIYPFCSIVKFLIALRKTGKIAKIALDDIFRFIIENNCTGHEDISFYAKLTPKACTINPTEKRQLREMIVFISQLSLLKTYGDTLWLDMTNDSAFDELLNKFLTPVNKKPKCIRAEEFMCITSVSQKLLLPTVETFSPNISDFEFIEGNRKRIEHLRVDRSPLLRKYFMTQKQQPVCDMCAMDVSTKYPWTDYMLDIHHLLPLSSSVAITTKGTSLSDIVGLCPSCHRSVHIYYTKWLKQVGQDDFRTRAEAKAVYRDALEEIV